jgi:hypothetical protein
MSLFRKKTPEKVQTEVEGARCTYCGKMDFIANMVASNYIFFGDPLYSHLECRDKVQGLKTCPICRGTGKVMASTGQMEE